MPYMEQIDFSGLIKLALPVIGAVDWQWFPRLILEAVIARLVVLADTSFKHRLVEGSMESLLSKKRFSIFLNKNFSPLLFIVFFVFYYVKSQPVTDG